MSARPLPLDPGVWGVLPTPFAGGALAVDTESLARLVAFFADEGSTGLVALGVFGEAGQLAPDEQVEVVRVVTASSGLPVVAGLSALATAPALAQAHALVAAGNGRVRAVMVQVPTADPLALRAHLDAIATAGVGLVVQDYPAQSGVRIAADVLAEVVASCPAAVAVKAESAPTTAAIATIAPAVDVPVFGGLGGVGLLDELAAGAAGAMTGFSHPEALWAAITAYRTGGFAAARAAYAPWLPLANFEGQAAVGLAIRKEILRRRGVLASAGVRPPARDLPTALEGMITSHLEALPAG